MVKYGRSRSRFFPPCWPIGVSANGDSPRWSRLTAIAFSSTPAHVRRLCSNAREFKVDLSTVKDVVLTHNHDDHTGGLITLRNEFMKTNPAALSRVHVAKGIFYSRPGKEGEGNSMIAIRKEYEATGGTFVEHDQAVELFPGAWLTGPVPRPFPERNWSVNGEVVTPAGKVEDTIPEDQSLVLNTPQGLVLVTGMRPRGDHQYAHVRGEGISRRRRCWRWSAAFTYFPRRRRRWTGPRTS